MPRRLDIEKTYPLRMQERINALEWCTSVLNASLDKLDDADSDLPMDVKVSEVVALNGDQFLVIRFNWYDKTLTFTCDV